MSAPWYYAIDDQEGGPVTPQELKKLADSGKLKPTDQVWKDGMPEWVAAGTIKSLCPAGAAAAPGSTRRTEPVTPANEIRREAAPDTDADDLEVEAPIQRPADVHIQPTAAAATAAADERRLRKKGKSSKSNDDDYMDYDEAFELGDQAKKVAADASRNAFSAFKTMLHNPVGGLDEAFVQLGPTQAIAVGVVFDLIFAACFFVGLNMLGSPITSSLLLGIMPEPGFMTFMKLGILSMLAPLGMLAGCAASRAMFKGQGGFPSDVFLGGAALLPLSAFILFDGLLQGRANELTFIGLIFASCTTVLMLYSGSTRIHRTPEAVATVAVPIMMLLSLWIPRIVAGIMF